MGNAFVAGLKNEAPRGRDITNEDRNSEVSQRGTQRDAEGSELSYRGPTILGQNDNKMLPKHCYSQLASYQPD